MQFYQILIPNILLLAACNISIGGSAFSRGIVYAVYSALLFIILYLSNGDLISCSIISILTTTLFALWRSRSPRDGELDLLWEPTKAEIIHTFKTHLPFLVGIALITLTWWIVLLSVVPVITHILVSNKTKFGRWLMKFGYVEGTSIFTNSGYHRRFGEFFNGLLMYGFAFTVLILKLFTYKTILYNSF